MSARAAAVLVALSATLGCAGPKYRASLPRGTRVTLHDRGQGAALAGAAEGRSAHAYSLATRGSLDWTERCINGASEAVGVLPASLAVVPCLVLGALALPPLGALAGALTGLPRGELAYVNGSLAHALEPSALDREFAARVRERASAHWRLSETREPPSVGIDFALAKLEIAQHLGARLSLRLEARARIVPARAARSFVVHSPARDPDAWFAEDAALFHADLELALCELANRLVDEALSESLAPRAGSEKATVSKPPPGSE